MNSTHYWRYLLVLLSVICLNFSCFAAGKPEITSHTVQLLDHALSVNIQWQSENPITKIKVIAGHGEKEMTIDEYDNRRNPGGYSGEASVVISIEPSLFQGTLPYQIQLEDDLRQRSSLFSGQTVVPVSGSMAVAAIPIGMPPPQFAPGVPGMAPAMGVGVAVAPGMQLPQPGAAGHEDGWGKENIRAGKAQGETRDGKSNDMIDKLLAVADRFDTPPSLEPLKVNVLGPENVSFTSRANDDKGIKEISFRVYDGVGNKVGEQILTSLGRKWEGSTQPIKIAAGGNFRVVAQAVDTGGNTSKEQVAQFSMKGTPPPATLVVTLSPQDAVLAGAQWQLDNEAWQASAAIVSSTPGRHKLTFKDTPGWMTPIVQDIEIKEGSNTAGATYVNSASKTGNLTVALLPSDVLKSGAQWQVDGGAWQSDSATVALSIGKHNLVFKDVSGWITPVPQALDVNEGNNKGSATYTLVPVQNGTLMVTIVPTAAVTAGAQWRIGSGAWQSSGSSLDVSAGAVVVELKDTAGWVKPANLTVTVVAAKKTDASTSYGRIYTFNKDFDEGQLVGLEDQTVKDQLQLSRSSTTLPFIWVPNSDNGTISKINSTTGEELGRYYTGPTNGGSPSRTTVDLKGNCWVGNRNTGTVVKVGLSENGQCLDNNKNGKIETSTGATALAWGTDECVLFEVPLGAGSGPRGIAIDKNNNVWAGTYSSRKFYYIDGNTGAILKTIDTSPSNHGSYGAVIDQNGIVWSADISNGNVLRLDPATLSVSTVSLGHMAYGIGLDKAGHLFVAGWTDNKLTRINTITGQKEWTKNSNASGLRGVAITNDGDVWVANSYSDSVTRWSNDGVIKATIGGFSHPTGVAVDADGKVWCVDYGSQNIHRINTTTNSIELTKQVGGSGHYGYSDMTGIVARSMTTKLGTWTINVDGGSATNWGTVTWSGQESADALIKVRARASADTKLWSNWEDIIKGTPLKTATTGRYIQLETTLQLVSGEKSPILTDLTITAKP